jgi:PEP-CTERM/exosortase A-associated glycosyltransferase
MRILHVLDHSLPLQSGYAFRTAAIVREQRLQGFETLQLTTPRQNGGIAMVEDVDGLRFHRTPAAPKHGRLRAVGYLREIAATKRRIDGLIDEFRPDVVHAHSPVLNVLPALRAARRKRIPVVYEVRALWEDAAVDHGTTREGSLRYRASRALETYALRRADHVTTICEGLRKEITSRGIDDARVTVIPNAVDAEEFAISSVVDHELRAHLGLSDKIVVGFAGSFYAYEGLDLLIDALAILANCMPRLHVLLVGGGPQDAPLREAVGARGLGARVTFTGRVPHAEVQRYYGLIDVLAYPRRSMRLTELVTPLKPLEAMAQGKMFIASDVGGHRELVRHGDNGFLFAAGDAEALAQALVSLLDARQSWPHVAERARRFVERERTWTRSVRGYHDVYASVLSARRPASARQAWS